MYKDKKILAIIPARAGSKGLPGKNIINLNGKPLIAWSIETGLKSKYVDKIVVSTDSEKIAEISRKFGAETPFIRPPELSTDECPSFDVVKHAIEFLEENDQYYDYIVLLEPTSPLREVKDIDEALERLLSNADASSIVSVCRVESQHPSFLMKLDQNDFLTSPDGKEKKALRRQDITDLYFLEGTIYISHIKEYLLKKKFVHDKTLGYVVPRWKSPEVDEMIDLIIIKAIMDYKGY